MSGVNASSWILPDDPATGVVIGTNLTYASGGSAATGSLSITGGAAAQTSYAYLGFEQNTTGSATVSGAGSTWTINSAALVGHYGNGALRILDGALVTLGHPDYFYLAYGAGSTGTVTVAGADAATGKRSSLLTLNNIFVGNYGSGTMNVLDGAYVSSQFTMYVGQFAGASGTVNVSGVNAATGYRSTLKVVTNQLWIGNWGQGALTVTDGGLVDVNIQAGFGGDVGSSGYGLVDGVNHATGLRSTIAGQYVSVGTTDRGEVYVTNGGLISVTLDADVGETQTTISGVTTPGNGLLTVAGVDQATNTPATVSAGRNVYVGHAAIGTLNVRDGGTVISGNNTYVGYSGTALGTVNIESGGSVAAGNNAYIGVSNTATGTVNVGNGGVMTAGSDAYVGVSDTASGTLNVGSGGTVTAARNAYIGYSGAATGTVNVDDGGKVIVDNDAYIGYGGTGSGTVNIRRGGVMQVGHDAYVGANGTVNGTLNIEDNGTVVAANNAYIGYGGTGNETVNIRNGGTLLVGKDTYIGYGSTANGTLNLAGDTVNGRGVLETASVIRGTGAGTLSFNGGVLRATQNQSEFLVNFGPLAVGAGGAWIDTNSHDVGISTVFTGTSSLNKLGTGTLALTGNSAAFTGNTSIYDGTLQVDGVLGGPANVLSAGRLSGSGQVGTVVNSGVVAPGQGNSFGTLTIAGNYVGSNGIIEMKTESGRTGSPTDRLLVTGNITGTTMVHIINMSDGTVTGLGNTDGISIIQVAGASSANAFQLPGGYIAAGPYQYRLRAFDPGSSSASAVDPLLGSVPIYDYRLQSMVDENGNLVPVPQVAGYQVLPTGAVRYGASLLDSLHKRLGELRRSGSAGDGSGARREQAFYMRTQGSGSNTAGDRASGYDQDIWFVQAGGNLFGKDMEDGATLRIGGAFSYGSSTLDVNASTARVDLKGTTVAITSTYQAAAGWYLDGVIQASKYASQIRTDERGQTGSPAGLGYGISLESGYPFELRDGLMIEPQAQLTYQNISFDRFTDVDNVNVDLREGRSLRGRFGARIQKSFIAGTRHSWSPFAEVNFLHEFFGNGSIQASGITFPTDSLGTSVQFGGGVNARLGAGKNFFASVSYENGMNRAAADAWSANIGFRIDF